jgi:hypothetical protein
MHKAVLFLGIGLVTGIAASAWWIQSSGEPPPADHTQDTGGATEPARTAAFEGAFSERIENLERAVAELRNDFALLSSEAEAPATARRAPSDDIEPVAREQEGLGPYTLDERIDALTEAGFSLTRARQIERWAEEHRVKAMQARYDAERRGESLDDASIERLFDTDAMLRSELGDADYERYLEAMGRPTTVDVMDVLASSAAEQAGMQPGDQIVSYDGQRVFSILELLELPLDGAPGEPVIIHVLRDEQPMQFVLPRGPLGISAPTGARAVQYVPFEEK